MTDTNASTEEPTGLQLEPSSVFTPTILTISGSRTAIRGCRQCPGQTLLIVLLANLTHSHVAFPIRPCNQYAGRCGRCLLLDLSQLRIRGGRRDWHPAFLSQTLSLTLYAHGPAESFMSLPTGVDFPSWMMSSLAAVIVLMVTPLAARSTELALKPQRPLWS